MAFDLRPPQRILMGPGPTDIDPAVLRICSAPMIGYADPRFFEVLGDVASGLRRVFRTANSLTLAHTASGTGALEACLANVLRPGDRVVVGVAGFFAERIAIVAERCGAEVTRVPAPWGTAVDPDALRSALGLGRTRVLAVVHGETSTGVRQPLDDLGDLAREHDALLLVDAVASLGGVDLDVDGTGIDLCYSGSQKCLSAPPGLAPLTVGARARAAIEARRPPSFYFDLLALERYWFGDHAYHHTPAIALQYALRESLRLIEEETLPARLARHARMQRLLVEGLAELGLDLLVAPELRLATVTTVRVPGGIDELAVRRALLQEYGIEIAGGLGDLQGRVWRVGLMGYSCQERNVTLLLAALRAVLSGLGYHPAPRVHAVPSLHAGAVPVRAGLQEGA